MAATGAIGGVVYFSIDGARFSVRGDFKIEWGGIEREDVQGADNTDHGWIEKPQPCGFELTLSDSGSLSLAQLQAITGATATLESDTGKVYVASNARQTGKLTLDCIEGKLPIKFGASFPIIEVLPT